MEKNPLCARQTLAFLIFIVINFLFLGVVAKPETTVNDGYGDYLLVPAGYFRMGDTRGDGNPDEKPVHKIYLDDYYIGKYEITNAEFEKFINDGGYGNSNYWTAGGYGEFGNVPLYWNERQYNGGGVRGNANFPVSGVNWFEAMAYCRWLSDKTAKVYRLPAEAEWEKAAKGNQKRKYPWGNTIDGSYANYSNSGDPYEPGLTPVGYYDGKLHASFLTHGNASPYGAYDMAGNLWEWCRDWYSKKYDAQSPSKNAQEPHRGGDRVIRGGSWSSAAKSLRCTSRSHYFPDGRFDNIGFRCVRESNFQK